MTACCNSMQRALCQSQAHMGTGRSMIRHCHRLYAITSASLPLKGVGVSNDFGHKAQAVADLKPRWVHNWWMYPGYALPDGTQFVPTVFSGAQVNDGDLKAATDAGKGSSCMMGFNEPDGHTEDQAGLAAPDAVHMWPQIYRAAQSAGLRLGSPAMGGDATQEGCWLDVFLQKMHQQVDFICVHRYPDKLQDAHGSADQLINYLEGVNRLYNGKRGYNMKIWLTEFAIIQYAPDGTPQAYPDIKVQQAFLTQAAQRMSGLPYLERYAWFMMSPWKESRDASKCSCNLSTADGQKSDLGYTFEGLWSS